MAEVIEATRTAEQVQIDYGKALSWYIKDPKFWPTVLTMSLYILSCFLILPMFYVLPLFTGYTVAQIRKIQQGEYEIVDIDSSYWKDGAKLLLLSMAVGMVFWLIMSIFIFGGTLLATRGTNESSVITVIFSIFLNLIGYVIQFVFSFGLPFLMLMAYAIYAKTGSINSVATWGNYKAMWRTNGWNLVVGYLVYYAGIMALSMIGFLACCIGVLPASVAGIFLTAGIVGQYDASGIGTGGMESTRTV